MKKRKRGNLDLAKGEVTTEVQGGKSEKRKRIIKNWSRENAQGGKSENMEKMKKGKKGKGEIRIWFRENPQGG